MKHNDSICFKCANLYDYDCKKPWEFCYVDYKRDTKNVKNCKDFIALNKKDLRKRKGDKK